jgi:polyisoprenoid-binding protein YceI
MKRTTSIGVGFAALTFLVSSLSLSSVVYGQSFLTRKGHIEFDSRVPLYTFTGRSDDLNGRVNLADSTVDFFLDLTTLKTGIGKRDKDMRITLDTKKYPFAEYFGRLTTLFDPASEAEQNVHVEGSFTIHGVSRILNLDGTMQLNGDGLRITVRWELNLLDYEIVPPRILFVKVDQKQRIRLNTVLPLEDS